MKSQFPSDLTVCLPIIRDSVAGVLQAIAAAPAEYSMIEVWLDYIEGLDQSGLEQIVTASGTRSLLVLFRRQNLEPIVMPESVRQQFLRALPPSVFVDFDIATQLDDVEWCRKQRADLQLVLSYHNYQCTPDAGALRALVAQMREHGAAICKFSTFCQSETDVLRLMSLLLELRQEHVRCCVLGMGAAGKLTRIIGPLLGSEIAYAPQDVAHSSAPGQITLDQLKSIFRELSF